MCVVTTQEGLRMGLRRPPLGKQQPRSLSRSKALQTRANEERRAVRGEPCGGYCPEGSSLVFCFMLFFGYILSFLPRTFFSPSKKTRTIFIIKVNPNPRRLKIIQNYVIEKNKGASPLFPSCNFKVSVSLPACSLYRILSGQRAVHMTSVLKSL